MTKSIIKKIEKRRIISYFLKIINAAASPTTPDIPITRIRPVINALSPDNMPSLCFMSLGAMTNGSSSVLGLGAIKFC